jgi:hypothetical protein
MNCVAKSGVLVDAKVGEIRSDALQKPSLLFRSFFKSFPTILETLSLLVAAFVRPVDNRNE